MSYLLSLLFSTEARYCYTRHKMDMEGDSVSVTKRCVALGDCLSTGCSEEDNEGTRVRSGEYSIRGIVLGV